MALIAAVASNGVIGRNGTLPWTLPEDLKHFRALTIGHTIIMGRRTWESIGRPLAGRQNIVVSSGPGVRGPGCDAARSLDEAVALATMPDPVFVIGGEALYRAALPRADVLYLTRIERAFDGDVRFPEIDARQWRENASDTHLPQAPDGFTYHFVVYERVPSRTSG